MRVAVVALDTRGGVAPYAALAIGLQAAGHDVRMIAPADAADGLRSHGLGVVPVTGDMQQAVRRSGAAELGRLERLRLMRRSGDRSRSVLEILNGCRGVEIMTGGIGGMVHGTSVAEKLGIPFVEAHLQPVGPPTAAFPGVLVPHPPGWLGATGRRVGHRLTGLSLRVMLGAGSRRIRTEVLGLPARPARRRPGLPVLYGISPHVIPRPPEWGPLRHLTGYWTLPTGPGWTPRPDLAEFLDAGPPPVCIGFGSMVGRIRGP